MDKLIDVYNNLDYGIIFHPAVRFFEVGDGVIFKSINSGYFYTLKGKSSYDFSLWLYNNLDGVQSINSFLPSNEISRNKILEILTYFVQHKFAKIIKEKYTDEDKDLINKFFSLYSFFCIYTDFPLAALKVAQKQQIVFCGEDVVLRNVFKTLITYGLKNISFLCKENNGNKIYNPEVENHYDNAIFFLSLFNKNSFSFLKKRNNPVGKANLFYLNEDNVSCDFFFDLKKGLIRKSQIDRSRKLSLPSISLLCQHAVSFNLLSMVGLLCENELVKSVSINQKNFKVSIYRD